MHRSFAIGIVLAVATCGGWASAQTAAPPKVWIVLASAGLALTSGNTDTSTVNAAYDITYDPHTKNVVKSDGLLLRGETEGTLSANRLGVNARDEYRIGPRLFAFGQNQFLKDEFKRIDYLLAPTGGLGISIFNTDRTKLAVDGGVGGVWEKNPAEDVRSSGALTAGEKLTHQLTMTTTVTQSFSGLWKTKDLEDTLFGFGAGIAVAMSTRTQIKIELLDTYSNKPPSPGVQKNDVAVPMAVVYRM